MAEPLFPKVEPLPRFPDVEQRILAYWRQQRVFQRTLEKPAPRGPFVFYEGPPTANGTPHNGHVLTRVIKDLFPRYRTMRGYRVDRKAGWDTHGLPVEVEVEKELRIHGKAAIESYGVEPFVRRCIDSVFRYTEEWARLTERIAFWCDLDEAYVTYHRTFVESAWWALSRLYERGLLYRGHKVVWWWAQGGTALSSAEVGLGYKSVDDPSCFVRFPLRDVPAGAPADLALVAWTTTPWTLPSNMYAAVQPNATYVVLEGPHGTLLVAEALATALAEKLGSTVRADLRFQGRDLEGLRYDPPFAQYKTALADQRAPNGEARYFRVLAEDFVTLDTGTGIVHIAPAFGEDDQRAFQRLQQRLGETLELLCAVHPDGTFKQDFADLAGKWVKDADKQILQDLAARSILLLKETYKHDYPFCWRSDDDPLIQLARPAWFIRTSAHKDDALKNNYAVQWLPPHIREGRMGDFLQNNVDWALSRERYWGTPLNVWVCEKDEQHRHVPASVAAIEALNPKAFSHFHEARKADPSLNEHLIVHKPWIDQVTFPCPTCGATMRRVPEVIDCWFDSGCMPFAQWGFPHKEGSVERVRAAWPADFISEAIDQTRGWFYSQLMISTLVFDDATRAAYDLDRSSTAHPYKTCIVLGHVCDREGKKESKSKGNYTPPEVILDRVRMEFAVVSGVAQGAVPKVGECFIAREDLEGLDLQDGARVHLYRGHAADAPRSLVLRASKKLPRRVVALAEEDRQALAAIYNPKDIDVKPVEVPRLPAEHRVYVEDPNTPAPGADAFRWFFYASSPPWTNTRHSLSNVRALQKDFAIKLRNVYSFFTIYANIDRFDPKSVRAPSTHPLDRWIRSELALTAKTVLSSMDGYDAYAAAQSLVTFVEALSNWYVRRSRERFWAPGLASESADKNAAYGTLHHVLVTLSRLIAPFVPFFAEELHQGLVLSVDPQAPCSVHLCDMPEPIEADIDEALSQRMADARAVVSLGLQVRTTAKVKVRQPLAVATIVVAPDRATGLQESASVIAEELNVHRLEIVAPDAADQYVTFKLKPNFRTLGPRLGKHVQAVKKALESVDAASLRSELVVKGRAVVPGVLIDGAPLEVTPEEVEVAVLARDGFAATGDRIGVVVLDTRVTPELRLEGIARELQSKMQGVRKELGLAFEDRVNVRLSGAPELLEAARTHQERIAAEVLCQSFHLQEEAPSAGRPIEVEGLAGVLLVEKANA